MAREMELDGETNAASRESGLVFCSGDRQIRLVELEALRKDPAARTWEWIASDSPQIQPEHVGWFVGMDECKPAMDGRVVLGSSSAQGGVVVIRRSDKACLIYAQGNNAHSIEMIGDDLIAVALSKTGDELRLYPLDPEPQGSECTLAERPAWSMSLVGGHGVLWDAQREVLWALGTEELVELRVHRQPSVSGEVLHRWTLPHRHGHDLMWWDEGHLAITMDAGVCMFDLEKRDFAPSPVLSDDRNVKSINRNRSNGRIMYTQGDPVFTTRLRFVGGQDLTVADIELYKARWA